MRRIVAVTESCHCDPRARLVLTDQEGKEAVTLTSHVPVETYRSLLMEAATQNCTVQDLLDHAILAFATHDHTEPFLKRQGPTKA